MHAANADKSQQLILLLHAIKEYGPISTLSLAQWSGSCAVSTRVSELRANGHQIKCERRGGIYFYKLAKGAM